MLACSGRCTRKNSQIDTALNKCKSEDPSVCRDALYNIVNYIKENEDKKRYCVKHGAAKVIVDAVKRHQKVKEIASSACLALYYMVKIGPEGVDACMEAGAPLMATETIMNNMKDVDGCINASDLIRKLVESSDTNKQIIKDMTFGQYHQFSITLVIMFAKMTHEERETTSQRDEQDKVYVLNRLNALSDVLYDDEEEDEEASRILGEEEDEDPRKTPIQNSEGSNNGNPGNPEKPGGGGRHRRKRATQKKKKAKRRNTRKGLKYV
jgi:hypothetical protein